MVFQLSQSNTNFENQIFMEYQSKSTVKGNPLTIKLNESSIVLQANEIDEPLPYSMIYQVEISKKQGNNRSLTIITNNNRSYTISNRNESTEGLVHDNSAGYTMFVRVLHFHLRSKGKVKFACKKYFHIPLWQKILVPGLLLMVSYFFGSPSSHLLLFAISLSTFPIMLILEKIPLVNAYKPDEIPLDFFPVETGQTSILTI